MPIASIEYRHAFGLKADINSNIFYLDDQTVIYPSGTNVILYNHETKLQRFIHLTDKSENISTLYLSNNKRWLVVGETGKKAILVIYETGSNRKRKMISVPEMESKEFISVAMSGDSKYLIAQTGAPEWTLYYWLWEKSKLMASIKTAAPSEKAVLAAKDGVSVFGGTIYQCSFSPNDPTLLCVTGNGIFKLLRYTDNALKLVSLQKIEQRNLLTHCWAGDDRIICGTDEGKIVIFDSIGEQKNEFVHSSPYNQESKDLRQIATFGKGFLVACNGGAIALYEKGEDVSNPQHLAPGTLFGKDNFKKVREFVLPEDSSNIIKIAINPSEDSFICSTESSQLYSSSISNTDVKGDEAKLELFAQSFHHGQITGLDTCIRKPLVVTCSVDRSVRVWNYSEESSELVKYFPEESFSVAIHPSGLYILVGFTDKLRLMNLLIDDIRPFKEFQIRGCRECKFSTGGQYFAAVTGNTIQIYSTWSFEMLGTLKGHNGKVKSISWASNDSSIISAGAEGAIYEWSLKDLSGYAGQGTRRVSENIIKSCHYNCVSISSDSKTIYAVGSDKVLREIVDGQVTKEIPTDVVLSQVAVSQSGKMLFVGTASGNIRSIKYPLVDAPEYQEHQAHCSAVSKLCISFDDQYLFSASDDGTFYIFKVFERDSKSSKRERDMIYADEILVTKSDLEEKNSMMTELKTRVEELKMENEYQLRLKDMNFNEKIKQVTEKYQQEIETLKITSAVLRTEKEKEEIRHEEEMAEEKDRHCRDLQELDTSQNIKLMAEYEKYQELFQKTTELQEQWESQMRDMQAQKNQALEELNTHFENKIQEKQDEMDQIHEEIKKQISEYEETTKETEEDADTEMIELRHRYERKLKDERSVVLKLKGENGTMRKKFNTLQSEIDTHKGEISKLYSEEKKLHSVIKSLEKDISGLRKEIHERDETIQDKEKRIYDLKKKNQELEKFKFVLDYKIKELKKQIEPRERDIQGMNQQIKEMDMELETYHKTTNELELSIADLRLKLKAAEAEVSKERTQVSSSMRSIDNFKTDLEELINHIDEPKTLKRTLKTLYQKYCISSTNTVSEPDAQHEYTRQREYFERTCQSLTTKSNKDQKAHRVENHRIMGETVVLISEINHLRRMMTTIKQKERNLQVGMRSSELGTPRPVTPKDTLH